MHYMILSGSSDIIKQCEFFESGDYQGCQWLTFENNLLLVLSEKFMALYKNTAALNDALGNGLKAMVDLPEDAYLQVSEQGMVKEFRAGFVGLMDQKVILITPNDIQLFASKNDALRNQNEIARLALT